LREPALLPDSPAQLPGYLSFVAERVHSPRAAQGGPPAMLYTIIGVLHFILFLIAAFEILTGSKPLGHKVLWLLLVLLFPIIGLVLYFLLGRGK
jgi:hypothetical protein